MRERPNRHAWKACEGKPSVGSNPTPSAMSVSDVGASDRRDHGQPDDVVTMPTMRDDDAMRIALAEARAALEHDDVPVGAVVVRNGVVIAARHNERELHDDPVAHAEILALRDAATHLGQWRLEDCTMYVTLEPCPMCAGALVNAAVVPPRLRRPRPEGRSGDQSVRTVDRRTSQPPRRGDERSPGVGVRRAVASVLPPSTVIQSGRQPVIDSVILAAQAADESAKRRAALVA